MSGEPDEATDAAAAMHEDPRAAALNAAVAAAVEHAAPAFGLDAGETVLTGALLLEVQSPRGARYVAVSFVNAVTGGPADTYAARSMIAEAVRLVA